VGGSVGAARVNYCQALKTLKKSLRGDYANEVAVRPDSKVAPRLSRG